MTTTALKLVCVLGTVITMAVFISGLWFAPVTNWPTRVLSAVAFVLQCAFIALLTYVWVRRC